MIIRAKQTVNFSVIPNAVMLDQRLFADDLGVLCYLLILPADWSVKQTQLAARFGVGRDKMHAIVRRLIQAGYVVKMQKRGLGQTFAEIDYLVYDAPQGVQESASLNEPEPEKPEPEKPEPVKPPLLNTKKDIKTEKDINILGLSAPRTVEAKLPKAEPDGFIAFWEAYPKRDGSADRKGAVKAFGSALKRAPLEIILDGARHFADAMTARGKTGTEFIPQARTWLNGDRWNERYESSTPLDDKQAKARAILEKYAYAPPESCS